MTRILLASFLAIAFAPVALAQGEVNGKQSLTKLFNDVAATAAGSTVRVRCDSKDAALGTVVDAKGLILTKGSELLFKEGSGGEWKLKGSVSVRLRDGSEYDAQYLGYHEKSDLAMLKIDATDLTPAKFVDAKKAEAGNMVAATGLESEPVAAGIVSAGVRKLYGMEAAVRNGNKGYLGIMRDITRENGVFVDKYAEEQGRSPAKRAGILPGDQIISVNDKEVNKFEDLVTLLEKYKPGDKVKVLVKRTVKDSDDTEELTFEFKLTDGSTMDRGEMQNKMGSTLSGRRTGFPEVITTDIVIRPNDCGGPLVDLEGRVLGITIARAGRVESWVLPKDVIQPIITELQSGKHKPKQ